MRKIILLFLLLALQYTCLCQNTVMDPLKAKLKYVKEDTAKLSIYLSLSNSSNGKDNLLYLDSAWKIIDQLFLKEKKESVQKELVQVENDLPELVISNYSSKDTTDWSKALPYFNSRLQTIEKSDNKKRKAAFLYTMAQVHLDERKDSARFRNYITKSVAIATEIKDSALIAKCYRFMCSFYKSAGNFSEALEAIQSSVAICRKLNYKTGLASSLSFLAEVYAEFGEDDLALQNFKEASDISNAIRDTNLICKTLIAQSGFYTFKNDHHKALEYLHKALLLSNDNAKMEYNTGTIYRLIGEAYTQGKEYENAMLSFEKSLDRSKAGNDLLNTVTTLHDIGLLYNSQQNFEKALQYHMKAMEIVNSTPDRGRYKPHILYFMALDNYGLKNYGAAKELNDHALVDFKKRWFDIKVPSQMEWLASQIDSARGDGFGALAHYKEYVLLTDKIKGEEIRKLAQKDKFKTEIEKQQSEQEKKDAIAQRTRNLQYIAIGAFLLLGIFLAYGYVQKNKDKKEIEKAYGELKSTQAQLVQSEKMASLGELTAGIAHEIQNPLNFVNNFSEINKELVEELRGERLKAESERNTGIEDELLNDIEQNSIKINEHGKRADAIVKGMLQHSQSSKGQKEPTDINKLADEYLRLAYHGVRAKDNSFNATLKTDFDESIGNINIIPQDIGRVLLNLITNAFYAVGEKQKAAGEAFKPVVAVQTKKIHDKIEIQVADNGNGIPQNIIDKIFQPFFTTKPTGQGTGLGLSLAYDIVKAHGGELKVQTKAAESTTFIISIPTNN